MVFNKLFRKNKRLKQILKMEQNEEMIFIEGQLKDAWYQVKELQLIAREQDHSLTISNKKKNNKFEFMFNINNEKFLTNDEQIYDLFLVLCVHEDKIPEDILRNIMNKPTTVFNEENGAYEYPIRLGRFDETETVCLKPYVADQKRYQLYKTVKGSVSIAINTTIQQEIKTQIDNLKTKTHEIEFNGKIFTRTHKVEQINLIMIGRKTLNEMQFSANIKYLAKETKNKFGLNRYEYSTSVSFDNPSNNEWLAEDVFDLFFDIKFEHADEVVRARIGKPRFKARVNLKSCSGGYNETVYAINPYYTFRLFNLSLQVNSFDIDVFHYLKKAMRWSFLTRLFNRSKKIWLIGERPEKAEDTGYHFFKYMRERYPEKNVFYVIDKDSPNINNVLPYGNVVYFKSKEHIKTAISARRVIGSHHPDYLYPLRTKEFERKVKAKKVFLQHGVMGTKNMVANYGKNAPGFDTDMFLVSSESEREMIINDFGYDVRDVKVTGLSRFDALFEKDVQVKRQLLIIPTWREWLVRDDLFLESDYYNRYRDLVFNEKLHELAKSYHFEIVFCLHPNMRHFLSYFQDAPVRVINQGEVNVQLLLKESSFMITDYSSVAFDFSFLEKPIIYYQFDRERFIGKRGSHLDLDNDLPGDIVFEVDDVLHAIEEYARNDFKMEEKNVVKSRKFISYKDQKSSERIEQVITHEVRRKSFVEKLVELEFSKTVFNRFRRSRLYFPTMKLFYNIAKRVLPVDQKLVLFESGIGKQYADSPKNIYEEMVYQNLDYKKVWVCNESIRFPDVEKTKRIKRLSPSYYYYLARAKVWVNNQNFPTYIKKRKQTTYLQTWHGTPLKKMLHDIENIMGRSDGYLERVSNAVDNWDYLIAPSEYATKSFKSAFQYKGEILQIGYPRNDLFYRNDQHDLSKRIKSRLNIPSNDHRKIVLYAPTFRDNQTTKNNRFTFDIEMDLMKMQEILGEDYIILLRMHVVINNKLKLDEELSDFVIDVSSYSDMQELLLVTDVLITDYSSVMFDFANTKRPMLFFTYDLETYRDDVRGFYMDFEREAPGPLVRTTSEIIESLQNIEDIEEKYLNKYYKFHQTYCNLEDGNASKRVVNHVFKK